MSSRQPESTTSPVLAALELPSLDTLTDDQTRGRVCAWDSSEGRLTPETAVDLGERLSPLEEAEGRMRWFPRGCRHHVGQQALVALFHHASECDTCKESSDCAFAVEVRQLMRGVKW